MKLIIQRTNGVELLVNDRLNSSTKKGLLVLFGTKSDDTEAPIVKLADKVANLRIFEDDEGKMNLSLKDINGELMVVSQFTLYADTKKGRRPSFNKAQEPKEAERLYNLFVDELKKQNLKVETGVFGAKMDIKFNNDGPVTIIIDDELL
jgi:D-tyrosyl-tRNA(Tyr) deacylase